MRLRTTNGLERIICEIIQRIRVDFIFADMASCPRLVSAILAEDDKEWITGKVYIDVKA